MKGTLQNVSESCCQILEKYYFEMNNAYTKNVTVDYDSNIPFKQNIYK